MAKQTTKPTEVSGWVGWIFFAATMLMLLGGLQIISGLVAIFNSEFYVVTANNLIVLNLTAWGWIHMGIGAVLIAAGLGLVTGQTWARIVAVAAAVVSALANLSFLPVYPVWSIIALTIDAFVIYAVTMHGNEVKQ
jgi:hypothetical protein